MKTIQFVIAVLVIAAVPAFAGPLETAAPPPVPAPRQQTPMMAELSAAMDASRDAVAELSRGLEHAANTDEIMALQREITRIKDEARIETFRIQLRYAVAEHRSEDAARLESLITALNSQPEAATPVRPAPAQSGSR